MRNLFIINFLLGKQSTDDEGKVALNQFKNIIELFLKVCNVNVKDGNYFTEDDIKNACQNYFHRA